MNDSRRGFLTKFGAFVAGAAAPTKVVEFFADPTSEIEQKLLDAHAQAWAESAPLEDVIYKFAPTDSPLNGLAQNGMGVLHEWDEDSLGGTMEETYIDRMKTEKSELDERSHALADFTHSDDFVQLHPDEQRRCYAQREAMAAYSSILAERIQYAESRPA